MGPHIQLRVLSAGPTQTTMHALQDGYIERNGKAMEVLLGAASSSGIVAPHLLRGADVWLTYSQNEIFTYLQNETTLMKYEDDLLTKYDTSTETVLRKSLLEQFPDVSDEDDVLTDQARQLHPQDRVPATTGS